MLSLSTAVKDVLLGSSRTGNVGSYSKHDDSILRDVLAKSVNLNSKVNKDPLSASHDLNGCFETL